MDPKTYTIEEIRNFIKHVGFTRDKSRFYLIGLDAVTEKNIEKSNETNNPDQKQLDY